ncbi:MAG: LamG-like jellyroll fold domain-containing protein [Planctomycetota bacterium]|jgi:hypothetical protein
MEEKCVVMSIVVVFLLLSSSVVAEERYVPSEYATIQDAIDAANNGDIVIVAEGTYTGPGNRDISFLGKAISVRSSDPNDPDIVAATIINCQGTSSNKHRGFIFHNNEGNSSILGGLTIANGHQEYGGGIYCYSSNPIISRCVIRDNTTHGTYHTHGGGGIYCKSCSPKIENCTIINNISRSRGGGIYCEGSSASIDNCTIINNKAQSWGSGIFYNAGYGGGICCFYGNPKIKNSIITDNSASYGGGIHGNRSNMTVKHCTIAYNRASRTGGIYRYLGSGTINNSILWGNTASSEPVFHSNFTVSYCNVEGGYLGEGNVDADPCFINPDEDNYHLSSSSPCINTGDYGYISLPGDTDIDGDSRIINGITDMGADEVNYEGPLIGFSTTKVEFHAIETQTNPENKILGIINIGTELLSWEVMEDCSWLGVNPVNGVSHGEVNDVTFIVDISGLSSGVYNCELIVTGPGAINSPRVVEVSLVVHAPVIELSTNSFEFLALEDGPNPNVQELGIRNADVETLNWVIDSNCDWLAVTPQVGFSTGENDIVTMSVDSQGMAAGTYSCDFAVISDWATNSPQVVSVSLYIGVALNVPSEYSTIQTAINASEKGDTVLIADGIFRGNGNRDIDFKGKAITVRSKNGPANCIIDCQRSGRGFNFHSREDSTSVLDGVTITNGYSEFEGGGICCWDNSSPTITNCNIIDNMAFYGGGIGGYNSKPVISNCFIARNFASDFGGGLCRLAGLISNCIIAANKAVVEGGGLYWYDGDITNCLITGNTASIAGGLSMCKGNIIGCTISSNKAERDAGGLHLCHGLISNSIIWGNIADFNPQIFNSSEPVYSCIQDWPYLQNGNIDEDPLFVSPSSAWQYWDQVPFCHWKFDEGEGDAAYDSSGPFHGNIIDGEWTQGQIGGALRFNGEFSHIIVNDNHRLGFDQYESFSISAWIKCNKDNSDIINKGFMDGIAYNGGYDLGIYQNKIRFAINDYDNTFTSVSGTTDINDDQWHYVVAVREITERKLHLYVDGEPDVMPVSDTTTTWIGSQSSVKIGERFGGIIDELVIQKGAFSIEQIQHFYEVELNGQRLENEPNYGDYHLLPASPCIDSGDPNYVLEPNELDLDGNLRELGPAIDMGAYEYVPPTFDCEMWLTPSSLNLGSKGNWVKAHFVLPEVFVVDDVDVNHPCELVEPFEPDVESEHVNVFVNGDGLVEVEAAFMRSAFCSAGSFDGDVTVVGRLTNGREFVGTDTISVIDRSFELVGELAGYWLRGDCEAPGWCEGLDLNEDGVVNFADFARLEGCEIN